MKAAAVILVLLGLASIAGGVVFFVKIAQRAAEARVVKTLALTPGAAVSAEVAVSVERKCQVSFAIHPDLKAFGDADWAGIRKDYPLSLSYRVTDQTGGEIMAQNLKEWQFGGIQNGLTGFVEYSYNTSKFDPPASGRLKVSVEFRKEGKSGRFLESEAKVYDTVSDHTKSSVYGTAFGLGGGVLVLLGGGLFSLSLLNKPKPSQPGIA